jgi:hypothetical protein
MQIDLIDMRSTEYDGYKWIFHAKDHFSKYSWLRPLVSKEAINVAQTLESIFYQFGPPRILQSDNGREFVAKVILDLTKTWPGLVIINGRPRHPQSQGLVERSNAVVQQLLGKWMDTNHSTNWPSGLGPVMFAINTSVAKATKQTPFEIVFGQQPRSDDQARQSIVAEIRNSHLKVDKQNNDGKYVIFEEDIPNDIFDLISEVNEATSEHADIQSSNLNEEAVNSDEVIASTVTNNQIQNDEEVARLDVYIDHEELISGGSEPAPDPVVFDTDCDKTGNHKRIREQAEQCYLNNAQSQLTKYINRSAKRQRTYIIGDIIGLKVCDVDRTNTSSTILPCKVVNTHDQDGEVLYTVATKNGIIKETFPSTMFLDLTTANFASLRSFNTDSLPSITFIQACQIYTNFKSTDTCKCAGDCSTNRCQCKKKNRRCCTKCHSGEASKCKNC